MSNCISCEKELTFNDIGAHKKFINRGATSFLCKKCLARKFDLSEELIEQKIAYYKSAGCTLFV